MKQVLLSGATGRMGIELSRLLLSDKDFKLRCGLSLTNSNLTKVKTKEIDIAIDFSNPKFALALARWCAKNRVPLVSGTTGFTKSEFKTFCSISKKIPLLHSSNMSVGVAILRRALKGFSSISDFDFQIIEAHHNKKKDAPSGTAKTLQEDLERVVGRKVPLPLSVRGGGIVGVHQVFAMSEEEVLEFSHTALNRSVFARGALDCARFLIRQEPGLYSMNDILD